jgi:hypothetical protein
VSLSRLKLGAPFRAKDQVRFSTEYILRFRISLNCTVHSLHPHVHSLTRNIKKHLLLLATVCCRTHLQEQPAALCPPRNATSKAAHECRSHGVVHPPLHVGSTATLPFRQFDYISILMGSVHCLIRAQMRGVLGVGSTPVFRSLVFFILTDLNEKDDIIMLTRKVQSGFWKFLNQFSELYILNGTCCFQNVFHLRVLFLSLQLLTRPHTRQLIGYHQPYQKCYRCKKYMKQLLRRTKTFPSIQ